MELINSATRIEGLKHTEQGEIAEVACPEGGRACELKPQRSYSVILPIFEQVRCEGRQTRNKKQQGSKSLIGYRARVSEWQQSRNRKVIQERYGPEPSAIVGSSELTD